MIKEKNYRLIKAIKESCKCNKEDAGGGGLTGNVIDDWVNAVTQGEYTKYDDIPEPVAGTNLGWTKEPTDLELILQTKTLASNISTEDDFTYSLRKDAKYQKGFS